MLGVLRCTSFLVNRRARSGPISRRSPADTQGRATLSSWGVARIRLREAIDGQLARGLSSAPQSDWLGVPQA